MATQQGTSSRDGSPKQTAVRAVLEAAATLQTARATLAAVHEAFENAVEVREMDKLVKQLNDLAMRVSQMKGL